MRQLIAVFCLFAATASADVITGIYNGPYTLDPLGTLGGSGYGAIDFDQGNNNMLLLGVNSGLSNGAIDAVPVTRDPGGHVNGFGTATVFATTSGIDSGLAYAPNGDLLYTLNNGTIGELKPGSTNPSKTVASPAGSSYGTIIPSGVAAGTMIVASYGAAKICTSVLTADGSGTYNLSSCGSSTTLSNPVGMAWIAAGSPLFSSAGMLVGSGGSIYAYTADANGLPISSTAKQFASLNYGVIEGMTVDPVTGDLLVSTTSRDLIYEIQGFAAPSSTPEPGSLTMAALGLALCGLGRRSLRRR